MRSYKPALTNVQKTKIVLHILEFLGSVIAASCILGLFVAQKISSPWNLASFFLLILPIPLILLQIRGIRAQRPSRLVNAYVFLATDIVIGLTWIANSMVLYRAMRDEYKTTPRVDDGKSWAYGAVYAVTVFVLIVTKPTGSISLYWAVYHRRKGYMPHHRSLTLLESLEEETTDVWNSFPENRSAMESREDLEGIRDWAMREEITPLKDSSEQSLVNSPSYGTSGR